jgi:hypothetical protein
MGGAEEVFPNGASSAHHGAELGIKVRDLAEGEELPDLINPRLPHQPGSGVQPPGGMRCPPTSHAGSLPSPGGPRRSRGCLRVVWEAVSSAQGTVSHGGTKARRSFGPKAPIGPCSASH